MRPNEAKSQITILEADQESAVLTDNTFMMRLRNRFGLSPRRYVLWTVAILWAGVVIGGLALLAGHGSQAGTEGRSPRHWPSNSHIPLNVQGHTLVMFAHPRCPCTRASLSELEKLVAHCPETMSVWVVFYRPADGDETWQESDQWLAATRIPGVSVVGDPDGAETQRFGAATSGQTLLYDRTGELLFSGGITIARGHAGDSPGQRAIEQAITHAPVEIHDTPVFGCPILIPSERQ